MKLVNVKVICSLREVDFVLYREALLDLDPYFFTNNNINYARWIPVYLRDMMSIEQQHSQVAREFHKGDFVVHKSCRKFPAIPISKCGCKKDCSEV